MESIDMSVGTLVPLDSSEYRRLKQLCGQLVPNWGRKDDFPGSHVVPLERKHFKTLVDSLYDDSYYICEKSDGVRYLLLIENEHQSYMIDRKFCFYSLPLTMPPKKDINGVIIHLNNTLLDGELVTDNLGNGRKIFRFLIFDVLATRGSYVDEMDLTDRLTFVQKDVLKTRLEYAKQLKLLKSDEKIAPSDKLLFGSNEECTVELKEFLALRHIGHLFNNIITNLKHHNDGVIFTPVKLAYKPGQCNDLFKWKPDNTVDFWIQYESLPSNNNKNNDIFIFSLYLAFKDSRSRYVTDYMTMSNEEYTQFANNVQTYNGKIVECVWDPNWITKIPPNHDIYRDIQSYNAKFNNNYNVNLNNLLNNNISNNNNNNNNNNKKYINGPMYAEDFIERKGGWRFERFREDKNKANGFHVYYKTMNAILSNEIIGHLELIDLVDSNNPRLKKQQQQHQQQQQQQQVVTGSKEIKTDDNNLNVIDSTTLQPPTKMIKYNKDTSD